MEEKVLQHEDDFMDEDDKFLQNLNSKLYVNSNFNLKEYDYAWLDVLEDTVPYIDNIIRNPKRFIINEEEVVNVELSRKVTVESVIHLSQHTNLIQKIEDNGDVKPSKVLNINKEESLDTYENRFIYTLINNLRLFFEERVIHVSNSTYDVDNNVLIKYEAVTNIDGQDLNISLNMNDVTKNSSNSGKSEKTGFSFDERVSGLKKLIDGFFGSELYVTLNRLHVPAVVSPIKKTNVILKNPNFRKAEELWNYIQGYETADKEGTGHDEFFDESNLKNEYDQAILMAFIANHNYLSNRDKSDGSNTMDFMIKKLINNLLDADPELTEDKLGEVFMKQLSIIKMQNEERRNKIFNIMLDRFERECDSINGLFELFGKEDCYEENV